MSNRTAPWTDRIFELLADGPQPLEWVIAEVRNMVPPGRAYRFAEIKRDRMRAGRTNKTGRHPKVRQPSEDETIRTGQRQIVMDSITSLVQRGRLEYLEGDTSRSLQIGRERTPSSDTNRVNLIVNKHQPTFTKRRLPEADITTVTGRPVDVYDIECNCGWTWSGGRQDPDGDWHVHATNKDEAKKAFTVHRRSFV